MPILFVISGILLILLLGNVFILSNFWKWSLIAILIAICLSFIASDISLGFFCFDIFSFVAVMITIILFMRHVKICFSDVLYIILSSLIFGLILTSNLNFLISYNMPIVFWVVILFSLVYLFKCKSGLVYVFLSSIIFMIISSRFDYINFGFSMLNFNFCFECMVGFVAINIVFNCLRYILSRKNGKGFYNEKGYNSFNFVNYFSL